MGVLRLVAAHRKKFPILFQAVIRNPHEEEHDAYRTFGNRCNTTLRTVRDYLDQVETASLPRIPTSTDALSLRAVGVVERAATDRAAVTAE